MKQDDLGRQERDELERLDRATRLADHPLLMMLFLSPAFRVVLILFALAVIGGALSIPHLWTTSPAGFTPVVKVSLVDLVQVRALSRSAKRLASEGKDLEAARAWQAALANNLADAEVNRATLRHLLSANNLGRRMAAEAVGRTGWLLRLTRTNRVDAELAAQVYARFGLFNQVHTLLEPRVDQLSPEEEAAYLKALFHLRRMDEFGARWAGSGSRLPADAELPLYHAAYLVGWGPSDRYGEGRERLESGAKDPQHAVLVARLRLAVCQRAMDAEGYANALAQLDQEQAARLADRIAYWTLLRALGRGSEAQKLATEFVNPPVGPWEVVQMADALGALGLVDQALQLLKRYIPEFGDSDTVWARGMWVTYASYLIEKKRWEELLTMALQLRVAGRARHELAALSFFMEGRALHGMERYDESRAAFRQAAQEGFADGPTGLRAGGDLAKLGLADIAWDVLEPLEKSLASDPAYWQLMYELDQLLRRDAAKLTRFAAQARALVPHDATTTMKYVAALLISRERPDEAAELSLKLLSVFPSLPAARIARAAALAQSQRPAEAESILKEIDPRELGESELTLFYLTRLEVRAVLGQFEQAKRDLQQVRTNRLFPSQIKWLESTRATLSAPAGRTN